MEFYKILQNIMEEKNLSIPEVARLCDLTDSTVRSIFDRKQKKISLNIAFKMSKGLHVSLERLNGEKENSATDKGSGITEKDIRIAKWFRSLPPEKQQALLALGDAPKDLSE